MARPKGSKNKPKNLSVIPLDTLCPLEEVPWQPKVKTQQIVPSAKPPKKKELVEAIKGTISEPNEEETSSSGSQCVSPATIRVSGFINIQANPRGGFFTGADIHETVEKAKAVASKQTITQVFIAFEVK